MFDSAKLKFQWPHTPFGDHMSVNNKSKGAVIESEMRLDVRGKYKWAGIVLRSKGGGQAIEVSGSCAMFLQGHNIYGSNDVVELVFLAVSAAMREIGLPFESSKLRAALKNAEATRIDLACSIQLPRSVPAGSVVRPLQKSFLDARGNVANFGTDSILMPRKSAPSISIYDKSVIVKKEQIQKWRECGFPGRVYFQKRIERLLRVEFRLKSRWLKSRGLERLGNWSVTAARQILTDELAKAFAKGSVIVRPLPECYELMTEPERDILAIWLHGWDLNMHRGRTTISQCRQRFIDKYGIDLTSKSDGLKEIPWELARLLRRSKVVLGYPASARSRGLIAAV
jgi:hypothetical protein